MIRRHTIRRQWVALAAGVAVLAIAACGGHGGGGLPGMPNAAATPYDGSPALANFTWGRQLLYGAAYAGPADFGRMQVYVQVTQQDAQGLLQYAQEASDPHSGLYRHFLTPQEIGARFGATTRDYQTAADYFVSKGLSVAGWPQRLMLSVSGPQAAMERAFGTNFALYEKNGVQFTAPVGTPHFSRVLPVTAVSNLVALRRMNRYFIIAPPRANANYELGYSPQQIRSALDFTGAYGKTYDGTGIRIGIIGTGPIQVTRSSSYSPWCGDADLAQLKALYGASAGTVCEVNVKAQDVAAGLQVTGIPTASPTWSPLPNATPSPNPGVSPTSMFFFSGNFTTPPPITAGGCKYAVSSQSTPRYPNCNPEDLEAQLDTQTAATLAPGAAVDFYLAYNSNDCFAYFPDSCAPAPATPLPSASPTTQPAPGSNAGYPAEGIVEYDPEIEEAIADNTADVISLSFGIGEADYVGGGYDASGAGVEPEEFAALASEGIAVFVSSGDNGVLECSSSSPCPDWPGSDPNVTSVGGVNLPVNEFGQLTGNITAWGDTNGGNGSAPGATWGGSGGGTSSIFAAPTWQKNDIGASMREQPDIALDGDPFTGVTVYSEEQSSSPPSGSFYEVGGTSVAAPEAAAMWALVLQACKATPSCATASYAGHAYRLGNAAPYFYGIYHATAPGSPPAALPYPQVFYDVVYGENAVPNSNNVIVTGAKAGPGYDLVTGIGVPFGGHLIQAVTGQAVP
jgi:subtilase family serine protease